MASANVELVRGIYDAVTRRDAVSPFEVYAEDIVFDASRLKTAFLYSKPIFRGHEGVRAFWREGLSAFGEIDMTADELIDAGDKVLAFVSERETGRASGVPVKNAHFAVWTLVAGKVTRVQMLDDRDEALEAAGLPGIAGPS